MLLNSAIINSLQLISSYTKNPSPRTFKLRGHSTERKVRNKKFFFDNNFEFKIKTITNQKALTTVKFVDKEKKVKCRILKK